MKARAGKTTFDNLAPELQRALDEAVRQRVDDLYNDMCGVIEDVRIYATALALNDVCGFGTVRIKRVLNAISEIINGYDNECFTSKERRIGAVDVEKSANAMKAELSDRGIVLEWD